MIRANRVAAGRGWYWIASGWQLFRARPTLWLSMALVYILLAVALEVIPFIGWLVLVLLTPLTLLGSLIVAKQLADASLPRHSDPPRPATGDWRAWAAYLRSLLQVGARRLFQGYSRDEKLMPVMVISTLLLGGVVAIRILAQLLKVGGAALPAMISGSVGPAVWVTALLGLFVVLALDALLLMAFLYTIPLIQFRRAHPLPALESSFSAALNNLGAIAIMLAVLGVLAAAARLLFHYFSYPLDYLTLFAFGLVGLPVLVGALYASYLDLFMRRKPGP